jgi:hypothetical protein
VSARLALEERNGLTTAIAAWFMNCAGRPGYAVEPKSERYYTAPQRWGDFAHSVICGAQRTPYSPIGDYMDRFWYMPEITGERARVHRTRRSDRDRHLHDHPWHFVSIILTGGYTEELLLDGDPASGRQRFRAGDVLFRHAEHRHRLEIEPGEDCWSLVFTSPNCRDWGFWTPEGFVPWREYSQLEPA